LRPIFRLGNIYLYIRKIIGKGLIPWSALPPSWTTACPHVPTKETAFELEIVSFPPWLLAFDAIVLLALFCRTLATGTRLAILSRSLSLNEKAFDSCKVKGQLHVNHIKWACQNYRLTPPVISYPLFLSNWAKVYFLFIK